VDGCSANGAGSGVQEITFGLKIFFATNIYQVIHPKYSEYFCCWKKCCSTSKKNCAHAVQVRKRYRTDEDEIKRTGGYYLKKIYNFAA
jgi:hypothetical protein